MFWQSSPACYTCHAGHLRGPIEVSIPEQRIEVNPSIYRAGRRARWCIEGLRPYIAVLPSPGSGRYQPWSGLIAAASSRAPTVAAPGMMPHT